MNFLKENNIGHFSIEKHFVKNKMYNQKLSVLLALMCENLLTFIGDFDGPLIFLALIEFIQIGVQL